MRFIKKYPFLFITVFIVTVIFKPEVCFIELGVFLVFWALSSFIIFTRIKKNGVQCVGQIVELNVDSEGGKIPTVQFTTQSGQHIKAQPFIYTATDLSKLVSSEKHYEAGMPLKYDPDSPERFILIGQAGYNFLLADVNWRTTVFINRYWRVIKLY